MPGALVLGHALHDATVLEHDVMCRDLAFWRTQPFQRGHAGLHAGVVQENDVGWRPS